MTSTGQRRPLCLCRCCSQAVIAFSLSFAALPSPLCLRRPAFAALLPVSSASAAAPLSTAGKLRAGTLLCLVEHASRGSLAAQLYRRARTVTLMCTNSQGLTLFHRVSVFVRCACLVCACLCISLGFIVVLCVSFVGLLVFAIRPDSAEGFSSCPSTGSRNEDKDWENDSTTSSTPSNAEYTGI